MKMEHSVTKRLYIKFRRRSITKKKEYNITLQKFEIENIVFAILILYSALRKVHSLFESEFSTQYDLVLPLSIYSIIIFP